MFPRRGETNQRVPKPFRYSVRSTSKPHREWKRPRCELESQSQSMSVAKINRRLALVATGGEPLGTGSPCAHCGTPRTALNTGVCWSDAAKTRLTFHYAMCDSCRSTRLCKRLREDPAAKLVQMGADAAARTQRPRYGGERLSAAACTELIVQKLCEQGGRCACCAHEVTLAAHSGIFMASLDKVSDRYDSTAQVLCLGCQRFFNDLDAAERSDLLRAVVDASAKPRPMPLTCLPAEFERGVEEKLRKMKQRERACDRPSRGAVVELSVEAARRRLCIYGLRCACALICPDNPRTGRLLDSVRSEPFDPACPSSDQRDERAALRKSWQHLHVVLRPHPRGLGLCGGDCGASPSSLQRRKVRLERGSGRGVAAWPCAYARRLFRRC